MSNKRGDNKSDDFNENNNNRDNQNKITNSLKDYMQRKLHSPSFIASILLIVVALIFFTIKYTSTSTTITPPHHQQVPKNRFFSRNPRETIPPTTNNIPELKVQQDELPPELQKTHKFQTLDTGVAAIPADDAIRVKNRQGWYLHKPNITTPINRDAVTDEELSENNSNLLVRPVTDLTPTASSRLVITADMITNTYPHDSSCFTQGYAFFDGELYESCGLYGHSSLRTVDYTTGAAVRTGPRIPSKYFAEGLVITNDANDDAVVNLLTWQEHEILRYKASTWEQLPSLPLDGEGWGMTTDGFDPRHVIISDGSDKLFWYDITTMEKIREVIITEYKSSDNQFHRQKNINELEWIPLDKNDPKKGEIWANVWFSSDIIVIDPNSGQIIKRINTSQLHPKKTSTEDVLNGIAYGYDRNNNLKLLFTGKKWKKTFEMDAKQVIPNSNF